MTQEKHNITVLRHPADSTFIFFSIVDETDRLLPEALREAMQPCVATHQAHAATSKQ